MANASRNNAVREAPKFREILRLDTLRRPGDRELRIAVTEVARKDDEPHQYLTLTMWDCAGDHAMSSINLRTDEMYNLASVVSVARSFFTRTYRPRRSHRPPNAA